MIGLKFGLQRFCVIFFINICMGDISSAFDLDLYGEHSTWIYEGAGPTSRSTFEDSDYLRIRALSANHSDLLRPYIMLSANRERVNRSWGYERNKVQYGVGARFATDKLPIQVFMEGRHVDEGRSVADKFRRGEELVGILTFTGHAGTHEEDDLMLSWYGDITEVSSLWAEGYTSGSGWIRLSAVSLGSNGFRFEMDPFDAAAYRECFSGCRSWVFLGVGLSLGYQYSPFSVAVRSDFGERLDVNENEESRSRDAARFLLVVSGEL